MGFGNEAEFYFLNCFNFSFPGVSRGVSWAESSGIFFHGISAPGAAENLWKRTFLLEKKEICWDKLGFKRNFWESRAAFSFGFCVFPKKKKKVDFYCLKVQKFYFFFHNWGNLFPFPNQNSMFKAAFATVCIPKVWELKKKIIIIRNDNIWNKFLGVFFPGYNFFSVIFNSLRVFLGLFLQEF